MHPVAVAMILALDDITFRPCGPKVAAAFANVNGTNDTVNYCITDNKTITVSGSAQAGYNHPAYQWQQSLDSAKTWQDLPGSTDTFYTRTYSKAGRFQYRMMAAEAGNIGTARCRVASNVLTINVDAIPVPSAANTSPSCVNTAVTLSAKNGNTYQWTGPNGFSSAEAVAPYCLRLLLNDNGKYYVMVTTKGGCSRLDSTQVLVSIPPMATCRQRYFHL